ncbi:MAG: hypothetical protein WC812_01350 [Candidatus Pacearchaeota archaeon]
MNSYSKIQQTLYRHFIPKTIHPFWLNLIKNNNGRIRICHHDDELVYCGGCFQKQGCISNKG